MVDLRGAADRDGEELWAIIPFLNCWELTQQAAEDAIEQEGPMVRVLLIDNGSTPRVRVMAEDFVDGQDARVLLWHHSPPLASLSATWNAALDFVWTVGGEHAWVLNNDLRLAPGTAAALLSQFEPERWPASPLFVSAVGVAAAQFTPGRIHIYDDVYLTQGGPDFSCYIMSKECHSKYRFDEQFIPCYCEDLDYHRRMMLGSDGRRIFSVNVPYLHIDNGSGTLKAMTPEDRARKGAQINQGSRAYYVRKWGGPVNEERYVTPFNHPLKYGDTFPPEAADWTTPELQKATWRDAAAR